MSNHLPTDPKARKQYPLYSGLLMYFPDALAAVANLSKVGNDQHNPGQPLHWAREKSTDQEDTLMRHLLESGTLDTDGVRHSTKVAWRALAKLQLEIEEDRKKTQNEEPSSGSYLDSKPVVCGWDTSRAKFEGALDDAGILWRGQLVREQVQGPSHGEWTTVPTDQADGCASDSPTRHEIAAHKHRLAKFMGDGDRNG